MTIDATKVKLRASCMRVLDILQNADREGSETGGVCIWHRLTPIQIAEAKALLREATSDMEINE